MGQDSSTEHLDKLAPARTLEHRDLKSVAKLITTGDVQRICVLTGAGVSTNAGIPDFRSPETGLYANLARLNLPYAEAVFDISYFRQNPEPFYLLARELYPGKYKPTRSHAFIALLAKKNLLSMVFTQNIDTLERAAGIPQDQIVEAHGSFATQHCIECKSEFPKHLMTKAVEAGEVPHCLVPQCNGLVKPDIVFFGEQLPRNFSEKSHLAAQAQLMLIIGTSLTVHPFAGLSQYALPGVPRVLFNLERVGDIGSRPDDVCVLSDCDQGIERLATELGWIEELEALWQNLSGVGKNIATHEAPSSKEQTDDALESEIEKLTQDIDKSLKFSKGHVSLLKDQLSQEAGSDLESKQTGSHSP